MSFRVHIRFQMIEAACGRDKALQKGPLSARTRIFLRKHLNSSLKNHLSDCHVAAMRNGQRDVPYTQLIGDLPRYSVQVQSRFAARCVRYLDVSPAHAPSPTRSQGFHGSFLRGESRGVSLELVFVAFAIGDFARRVESIENRVASAPEGLLDTIDFCNVQA